MSRVKTKNKRGHGNGDVDKLSSLIMVVLNFIDATRLPLASQTLPFGMPEEVTDFDLAPFTAVVTIRSGFVSPDLFAAVSYCRKVAWYVAN